MAVFLIGCRYEIRTHTIQLMRLTDLPLVVTCAISALTISQTDLRLSSVGLRIPAAPVESEEKKGRVFLLAPVHKTI